MQRPISYGELEHILTQVGLSERHVVGRHVVCAHPSTEAAVVLPRHAARHAVDPMHLRVVEHTLIAYGLVDPAAFRDLMETIRLETVPLEHAPAEHARTTTKLDAPSSWPTQQRTREVRMVVVGVGYGGMQIANQLIDHTLQDLTVVAADTDAQALMEAKAAIRVPLGESLTRGRGTGTSVVVGQRAAEETQEAVYDVLRGADLVFIVAGLGGGTGTGAAPVIAAVARELGALTVGLVTTPLSFEGAHRRNTAAQGIAQLAPVVDTLVTIPNDGVVHTLGPRVPMQTAFQHIGAVVAQAIAGITSPLAGQTLLPVTFADIRQVLADAGRGQVAFGRGVGGTRVGDAVGMVLNSPLGERPLHEAERFLVMIRGGEALSAEEFETIMNAVARETDPELRLVYSMTIDPQLQDEVQLVLLATGYANDRTR